MDSFDKYDEIDYTGKSDPDIWETHVEFFFFQGDGFAALRRNQTAPSRRRKKDRRASIFQTKG